MNEAKEEAQNEKHSAFLSRLKQYVKDQDEAKILEEISTYYREWSDIGSQRKDMAHAYLEQLKMLLLPTQVGVGRWNEE